MDTIWMWVGFNLFVVALLALNLGVINRGEKQITFRHALWLSLGYVHKGFHVVKTVKL